MSHSAGSECRSVDVLNRTASVKGLVDAVLPIYQTIIQTQRCSKFLSKFRENLLCFNETSFSDCSSSQFSCSTNGQCLYPYQVCNGVVECADGSDESGCREFEYVSFM